MRRTEALKVITRVLKQPVEDVPAAELIYGRALPHIEDPSAQAFKPWVMQVDVLAWRIAAQLPLTDEEVSPLAQAEDAKRRRDIVGEVDALTGGHAQLTSATWYPARPGDLVHVHYEAVGEMAAFREMYVIAAGAGGFLSMRLLAHTLPDSLGQEFVAGMVGCFAVDDDPDPLMELWMEAGPHRLTIVRDGQVVHDGPGRRGAAAAGTQAEAAINVLAAAVCDAERYLERGEPELALARLQSHKPLPPCGAPGFTPEQPDCARPKGHGGACSPDADYVDPPHECPALPEQLHAVVTVGAKVQGVHFSGLYEDRDAAADHAAGYAAFAEGLNDRYVQPAPGLPGETVLELPAENELAAVGVQLAVVVPLQVLPDPRAEDEWAAEGMATALGPEDYADDFRDVDE